jgi:DNA-binding NarL/FixJ family response regulator
MTRDERLAPSVCSQGYTVQETADASAGAGNALESPPAAVVAELWMPSVSGVQLCRLLKSEASTCDVPVILGGEEPKSRFWAERAGATAQDDGFFTQLGERAVPLSLVSGARP